jgi:lipopolysaccharide export LptBFGC system permease protein LptF
LLRLQRYLLGELLAAFALVLLIVTGIFLTGSLLQILQRFPEVSVLALVQATPLFVGLALPVTVPLSFLMACLLTFGRFADDNEFLAFQMGGISPRHAMAPAICAAAVVSIFTVALSCDVNPTLTSAKKSVLRGQIREQVDRMRAPSATNVKLGDMEMSWSGRDGEWFLDSFLTWTTEEASKDGSQKVKKTNRVVAKRASVKLTDETPMRLLVTLVDGKMPVDTGGGMTAFDAREVRLYIDLGDDETDTKGKDEMRAAEIYYRMVRLEPLLGRSRQTAEWRSWRLFAGEYWRRVALGLSPLAFALFGVPLGLIVRRGSRSQALVLALFVALPVYYPLLLWGDNLARQDVLDPTLALNLGNIVFGLAGTLMIHRICTR